MIKVEKRASTVLYKFLISNCKGYHFILPANVCPVVPLTFIKANIDFIFVDIDTSTHAGDMNLYISEVSKCENSKIGIMWVNSYGTRHNTLEFYQNIRKHGKNTMIIEDNCLCIPETERTEPTEEVDLELYSTGYSKFVQMPNEGGYGLLRDNLIYDDLFLSYNINGYKQQQDRVIACLKTNNTFIYEENDWLPTEPFISDKYSIEQYLHDIRCLSSKSKKHKDRINAIYNAEIPNYLKWGGKKYGDITFFYRQSMIGIYW